MTKKEVEKLIEYVNIKGYLNNDFRGCSKMYSMTTENIKGFLKNYSLKDRRVLTVAGSGDQRLNSYLMGASEVICFDVNPLCELNLKLKDTSIKELSYEDFNKFFGLDRSLTSTFLDPNIFNLIKDSLDSDAFYFYDFLINEFRRSPCRSVYFEFDNTISFMKEFNNYCNKKSYYELSSILENKKLDFINVNIDNLPEVLDGEKFDMILLSNISDYIQYIYKDNQLARYRDLIDRLMDNLNLYGTMQVGYIYSRYHRGEDVSKFHLNDSRHVYFPGDTFHSEFVNSYYHDGTYDKVITYQKIK